ncbi:PREDICTED: programmed cell death 6-interacting protein-like [Populus euphratica]|uniref:Programmed cell death 6-interacting protein-like n=1 Tax=Populus euphratica TaxID=75702 RepID=A0AAJ6UZ10_POPEU|nr:PREDICTED: programmed cell death 6-interacting protein-like [Populus euphratica]
MTDDSDAGDWFGGGVTVALVVVERTCSVPGGVVAAGCGCSSSSLPLLCYVFSLFSHLASLFLLPNDSSKGKLVLKSISFPKIIGCPCLQARNEEFSAVFNLQDYKASREKCYKQIQAAIVKYREIKKNINEGLKFYVSLQDAITNIKQQCSDFVMTRSIQCQEMIEDVQRQMAGLSFQDHKNAGSYSYPAVNQPHQTQRSSSHPPSDPQNVPHPHPQPQTQYFQPPGQSTIPGYAHPPPPYTTPLQPPPYHMPPAPGAPYPPRQVQQPPTNQEYGHPAYPGWRGPYYNAHGQQPGSLARPTYTNPGPYPPPHQDYYKQ